MSNDSSHNRLASLEAEIRRLRGEASAQTPSAEESPKSPKIEEVLKSIRESALILKEGNNPALDAAMQNEQRMVALANLVARLTECVMSGLGATGLMVQKLNEGLGGLYQDVGRLRQFVGVEQAPDNSIGRSDAGEVEVDNTGADGMPVIPAAPVPQAPVRAPQAAPIIESAPAGMPPEVAQLIPAAQPAPIASVVVK